MQSMTPGSPAACMCVGVQYSAVRAECTFLYKKHSVWAAPGKIDK